MQNNAIFIAYGVFLLFLPYFPCRLFVISSFRLTLFVFLLGFFSSFRLALFSSSLVFSFRYFVSSPGIFSSSLVSSFRYFVFSPVFSSLVFSSLFRLFAWRFSSSRVLFSLSRFFVWRFFVFSRILISLFRLTTKSRQAIKQRKDEIAPGEIARKNNKNHAK